MENLFLQSRSRFLSLSIPLLGAAAALHACGGNDFREGSGGDGGDAGGSVSSVTGSSSGEGAGGGVTATAAAAGGTGTGGDGTGGAAPGYMPACDAPAIAPSAGSCFMLGLDNKCNPVTNVDCLEACDTPDSGETFQCYTTSTHKMLCEECDESTFCVGGLACPVQQGWPGGNHCARYCCDDADCGSGKCVKEGIQISGGAVGLCLVSAG